MIAIESVILSVFGTVLGILVGLGAGVVVRPGVSGQRSFHHEHPMAATARLPRRGHSRGVDRQHLAGKPRTQETGARSGGQRLISRVLRVRIARGIYGLLEIAVLEALMQHAVATEHHEPHQTGDRRPRVSAPMNSVQ